MIGDALYMAIDGDSYYVFALRTAKLSYNKDTQLWKVDITNFNQGGVLKGEDLGYSYAPTGSNETDFSPIDIVRKPKSMQK